MVAALYGELTYEDHKRGQRSCIKPSTTVIWTPRARTAHVAGRRLPGDTDQLHRSSILRCSSSGWTARACAIRCAFTFRNPSRPKRRSGGKTFSTRSPRQRLATGAIKAMALVESHPIAYEMEEFLYNLRDYILGLESRALGLHGELDPFQVRRPEMAPARSQHHSVRRRRSFRTCERCCRRSRTSTALSPSAE